MTHAKQQRQIKVAFNSNGTVRWATNQLENIPFSENGVLFQEVTPCANCERITNMEVMVCF